MSIEKENKEPESKRDHAGDARAEVQTSGWDDSSVKVRNRAFPGPSGATEPLRIAMTKEAYADLVGHAKESVDREICGVLLGELCIDEYGVFVSVEAALRGGAARAGGTHVTFTQETWNEIHKDKEARFPRLQIVGWYHSHPGFGVEFSEMDMFIQRNFFSGPSQIAFVSDPLGGEEAICANTDAGIKSIRRFWVDGRERRCEMPRGVDGAEGSAAASSGPSSDLAKTVHDLEDRIRQLTDTVERQRNTFYSFLTFLGALAAICFLMATGYSIYRAYTAVYDPPEIMKNINATVPVEINGKPTLLTMVGVKWDIPPELNTILVQAEIARQKEREAAEAAATQAAAAATRDAAATQPK